MSQGTAEQLNQAESGFFGIPFEFTKKRLNGKKITPSALAVAGVVYTYDRQKTNPEAHCTQSYNQLTERLHIARSTLRADIVALTDSEEVKQTVSRTGATYEYLIDPEDGRFFVVDEYLCTEQFLYKRKKKEELRLRRFPKNTAFVYALIKTVCTNPEGTGTFAGSYKSIAKILNLHSNTVKAAINALISAGHIYRIVKGTGKSGQYYSVYTLNERLIRARKRAEKRAEKKREKQAKKAQSQNALSPQATWQRQEQERIKAADERAERDAWYARNRREAEQRVERFFDMARQDEAFSAAEKSLRALDIMIGNAEARGEKLDDLRAREKRYKLIRAERLAALHISEEDLLPKWHCKRCEDTGFDIQTKKACDCYSPPRGGGT